MEEQPINRRIWSGLWGYRESFLIISGFFIAGILLGYFQDKEISVIKWPINLYFGLVLILIILIFGVFLRNSSTFRWLSGNKNAISSISFYLVLIILLGLIPQKQEYSEDLLYRLGFSHILSSHFFLFAQVYLLLSLGATIIRKFNKINLKNIAFFINHFGLWLTLFAIGLGAGDLKKVKMEINKVNPVFEGIYDNGETTGDLGLAIQLIKFNIDFYPPKAYLIGAETGEILNQHEFISLKEKEDGIIDKWVIKVDKYLDYAVGIKEKFHPVYETGAVPAAYIIAKNSETGQVLSGWISCGSFRFPGNFLELSEDQLLVMADPEAKSYKSEIKIYTKEGEVFESELTVGKPVSVNGWKIYQTSYDTEKGRWSEISIVELVKDPWLWVVYSGLIMMVLGAIYLIITGKRKQ